MPTLGPDVVLRHGLKIDEKRGRSSSKDLATPLLDPTLAGSSEGRLRRIAIFIVATDTTQILYTSIALFAPFLGALVAPLSWDHKF